MHRMRQGLTLLLRQQARELGLAALERIGELGHELATLLDGNVLPGRERRLRSGHRLIELIQVRARTDRDDLLGGRIDDVERRGACDQFAADQQTEVIR